MKTTAVMSIGLSELPNDAKNQLLEILPKEDGGPRLSVSLPIADVRIGEAIKILQDHGIFPWLGGKKKKNEFRIQFIKEYEDEDLRDAIAVELRCPDSFYGESYAENGTLLLDPDQIDPAKHCASVGMSLIVSDATAQEMSRQNFVDLVLRGVGVSKNVGMKLSSGYVQIWSNRVLPSLSPSCVFIDATDGHAVSREHQPKLIRNGLGFPEFVTLPPELHYRRPDWESGGSFDVSRVQEKLAGGGAGIVVSQRFYEWCKESKLNVLGFPVRLDEV